MTDDLLRRFGSLNPVTDPDRLVDFGEADWPTDPVLRAVLEQAREANHRPTALRPGPERHAEHEEMLMRTLSPDRSDEDRRPDRRPSRRGWLLAAATAAVVIVAAVGVLTVVGSEPSGDVVAPTPEPEPDPEAARITEAIALAEAYIDARNAYDSDRARELVADEFITTEPPDGFRDLQTMELAFETHEAYGFHYSDVDCASHDETADRVEVRCDFLWTTELHRIGDHPPTPTSLTVRVEDGRIVRVLRGPDEIRRVWDPFVAFLRTEHRQFSPILDRALDLDPDAHQEVVEQLPRYFDLYEEWVEGREG